MTGKGYSCHKEPTGGISPSIDDCVHRLENYCEIVQIVVLLRKQPTVLTFSYLSVCLIASVPPFMIVSTDWRIIVK